MGNARVAEIIAMTGLQQGSGPKSSVPNSVVTCVLVVGDESLKVKATWRLRKKNPTTLRRLLALRYAIVMEVRLTIASVIMKLTFQRTLKSAQTHAMKCAPTRTIATQLQCFFSRGSGLMAPGHKIF